MSIDSHLDDLRGQVRAWLSDHAPKGWREAYKSMTHEAFAQAQRDWFQTLVAAGYAVPHGLHSGRAVAGPWRSRR